MTNSFKQCINYLLLNLCTDKKPLKKEMWLISENGNDAEDNGFELYKYLLAHKEIGITPVYVISKGDLDYEKVKTLGGKIVKKGSKEHFEMMYECGAIISSQPYGFTPDAEVYKKLAKFFLFKPKGIHVFLQSGITDKDISELHRSEFRPDIFCISTDMEHQKIWEEFEQPEDSIQRTGLCRFDNLSNKNTKKQILIMPTWRNWLQGTPKYEFPQSKFFQKWNSLLIDGLLLRNLKTKGYEIVFYCHPKFLRYASLFANFGVRLETTGIHELIKESEMLITDYSSVFYDMVYIGKKVIFWQFDEKRYFSEQSQSSYVDYSKFGTVVKTSESDVREEIFECLETNNITDDKSFFIYNDKDNCKRTVQVIKKKLKEVK